MTAVTLLIGAMTPLLLGAVAAAVGAGLLISSYRQAAIGELRCLADGDPNNDVLGGDGRSRADEPSGKMQAGSRPVQWQWRPRGRGDWHAISLRHVAVGGRLIGLHWQQRTLWIWPDSMPAEQHHALRRLLLGVPLGIAEGRVEE
ncbi:hypothetical protein [Halomonas binhaiensis]|uniref:Toxin CptA n=1 Tax=Halomonas binhaiensis TaxID=2562282 RepID=A0A5C1NK59_9GAMM|nr:hypothetical protein [Halomonas binhaiensis]QEM82189.1 hypothetical protein E4T21_12010 [Halomonas binhaiensis]